MLRPSREEPGFVHSPWLGEQRGSEVLHPPTSSHPALSRALLLDVRGEMSGFRVFVTLG